MPSYQNYYFQSGVRELTASGSWEARDFAEKFLNVRNLIPNVSAVLWRREALLKALDAVPNLRAGSSPGIGGFIWNCWPGRRGRLPMSRSR